ncbi:hypothetical protein H9L10_09490 [Phycicoccus endophyticus]|uniref:Uncharacterized protein n=1 Tax=Phycicoccus endophyticus TaxID=1690220 RepID=A0A7G9QYX8_9MICO|nr:hypothetical protein [Phycicoccus endophyticus]NHI18890.1 hypothetical protein [Phycicoccus endophyticus]QNN48553.1 hypothetical protein H9L10_09490 [Phycicoccus endophyticus]GGL31176.1 hypothetical protein GCM10012283_11870 [Phycicoccus endophyticus]
MGSFRARVLLLFAGALVWLVLVFVSFACGWLPGWILPVAFVPLTTVASVAGAQVRSRREATRTGAAADLPPMRAPSGWVGVPLVLVTAVSVVVAAGALPGRGGGRPLGILVAGVLWVVLAQLHHATGGRPWWNLPPGLYAAGALVSLALGALLSFVGGQEGIVAMGAVLGSMLTWLLVWLWRRRRWRRAQGPSSGRPAGGATIEA